MVFLDRTKNATALKKMKKLENLKKQARRDHKSLGANFINAILHFSFFNCTSGQLKGQLK